MARTHTARPATATLTRNGVQTHVVDLAKCWQGLLRRQAEDERGHFASNGALAKLVGTSRTTVGAFFAGGPVSLGIGVRIIGALRLDFAEVARELEIVAQDEPAAALSA